MQIKRTFTFIENIDVEAGKQINPPLRKLRLPQSSITRLPDITSMTLAN